MDFPSTLPFWGLSALSYNESIEVGTIEMKIGFRIAFTVVFFFLFIQFLSLCNGMTYIASLAQVDLPHDIHLEDIHPDHIVPMDPFLGASGIPVTDSSDDAPPQRSAIPAFATPKIENERLLSAHSRQRMPPFLRRSGELWLINQTLLI